MSERTEFRLTALELAGLKAIMDAPEGSPAEKSEAVLKIVLGLGMVAANESIDPTAYAVPDAQWRTLCAWLMGIQSGPLTTVNLGLQWMNLGPSAFEEASHD